ncbi:MAG: polysaccharide deacetylase family protein [Coriobacteriia bacterium]
MTSPETTAPSGARSFLPWLVGAFAAILIVGLLVAWGVARPLHITVNGVSRTVTARSTLLDLQTQGLANTERGALLSLQGKIIQTHGGAAGTVTRNGRPTTLDQRLFEGDVIVSRRGADKTEGRITRLESLPIVVVQEGTGPVVALRRLGAAGVAEVTVGKTSGVEATRSVIATGDDMVVVHRAAAPTDKLVALTFDDGPWPGQTEKILAILNKENVHATFFMVGSSARTSPDLVRKVAAGGHTVGSHSLSHHELTKLKPAAIRKEISAGASAIAEATGVMPLWFRPPYGDVNSEVRKQARAVKAKVVLWDIDTLDWTLPGVHMLYRNAVRSTKPGQIVLMHDGGGNRKQTIEALPIIIEDLQSKGYTLVTLDELAAAK